MLQSHYELESHIFLKCLNINKPTYFNTLDVFITTDIKHLDNGGNSDTEAGMAISSGSEI